MKTVFITDKEKAEIAETLDRRPVLKETLRAAGQLNREDLETVIRYAQERGRQP